MTHVTQLRKWLPTARPGFVMAMIVMAGAVVSLLPYSLAAEASAASASAACQNLTSSLSSDKNYYIFTATAAPGGDNTEIAGYLFNFGDHQSYSFGFDRDSERSRSQATATHVYGHPGTYVITAAILTNKKGKVTATYSPNCQLRITIGQLPTVGTLVNTGPGSALGLFIAMSAVGAMAHYCYRTLRRSRPLSVG